MVRCVVLEEVISSDAKRTASRSHRQKQPEGVEEDSASLAGIQLKVSIRGAGREVQDLSLREKKQVAESRVRGLSISAKTKKPSSACASETAEQKTGLAKRVGLCAGHLSSLTSRHRAPSPLMSPKGSRAHRPLHPQVHTAADSIPRPRRVWPGLPSAGVAEEVGAGLGLLAAPMPPGGGSLAGRREDELGPWYWAGSEALPMEGASSFPVERSQWESGW
ncbi:uncharacterized protein LOC119515922 [Choloepus didactylus]|uniref:uncharacterized protein LOC119515922 n=1 Tax=Choloepus didactylus TaxID=27675 RepID=UPI00189CFAAE|nr:uncharacterized protein LOC119515922 [Choloepus didactylus]